MGHKQNQGNQDYTRIINFDECIQEQAYKEIREDELNPELAIEYTNDDKQSEQINKKYRTGFETYSECNDLVPDSTNIEQEIDLPHYVNTKIFNCQKKIKKELKYPGESKNIPKNFARALREYIKIHFPNFNQKDVHSFINLGCEQTGKHKLLSFLNTSIGAQIARRFFGDFGWAVYFLKDSKADVGQYFRFYNEYYNQSH